MPDGVHFLEDDLALHASRRRIASALRRRLEPRNPNQPRREAAEIILYACQTVRLGAGRVGSDGVEVAVLNAAFDAQSSMSAKRSIDATTHKFRQRRDHAAVAVLVSICRGVEPGAVQPAFAEQPNRVEPLAVNHGLVMRAAEDEESVLRIAPVHAAIHGLVDPEAQMMPGRKIRRRDSIHSVDADNPALH